MKKFVGVLFATVTAAIVAGGPIPARAEIFRSPIDTFEKCPWPKERAADLRKMLVQIMERHIEKKLVATAMLQKV